MLRKKWPLRDFRRKKKQSFTFPKSSIEASLIGSITVSIPIRIGFGASIRQAPKKEKGHIHRKHLGYSKSSSNKFKLHVYIRPESQPHDSYKLSKKMRLKQDAFSSSLDFRDVRWDHIIDTQHKLYRPLHLTEQDTFSSSLDFSDVRWDDTIGRWVSPQLFTVFLRAETLGVPYVISQTFKPSKKMTLSGISQSIVLHPMYSTMDPQFFAVNNPHTTESQDPLFAEDRIGNRVIAIGDERLIYYGSTGRSRFVRCQYAIFVGSQIKAVSIEETVGGAKPIINKNLEGVFHGEIEFNLRSTL